MSELSALLKQSSHYFAGRIFLMAAGLISFPILTRIFPVADYGILGLISTTLFIAIAITKLGFPNATVRFYAEFKADGRLTYLYSTIFSGSLLSAGIVAILFFVSVQLIRDKFTNINLASLLSLCSILLFTSCINDILTSFLRAEQRTKLYNLIGVLHRYGSLALSVFLVLFFIRGLYGFYAGHIISSIIVLCGLLYAFRGRIKLGLAYLSPTILKQLIKFGFPMVWAELGHLILNYADRYLIHLYLGTTPLGLYTAGYNLAVYVTQAIIYPINYAMEPIYMNIFVKKGEQETKQFFTKTFTYFLLTMFPIVFGLIAVGKDLISFLASARYIEASSVLPYVIIGQAIYASTVILNSGLFIRKKTHILTIIMIVACLLNVGLNVVLIPSFGIIGAAQATLVSYIFYTIVITYYAFKEFKFQIDFRRISLYLAVAVAMYLVISLLDGESSLTNLATKIPAGALFYCTFVLVLDRDIRKAVYRTITRSVRI